jgi:signal transduction histidine kinase
MNGMDDNAHDTNFSDDSLDALPDNALVELEQNAIRSTQQPPRHYPQSDHLAQASNRYDSPMQRVLPRRIQPDYEDFDSEHFDAGLFDDAGVATPVEKADEFIQPRSLGRMRQRENWRQERFGRRNHQDTFEQPHRAIQQQQAHQVVLSDSGDMDQEHDVEMQDSVQPDERPQLSTQALTSEQEMAFRAQIADLLRERNKLATELHDANSTVMVQRGEIAIVRSNQSKT